MMKSYQRIAPSKLLGVISSGGNGRGGVCFDASGSLVLSSALQDINVFNVRMGQQVGSIEGSDTGSADYPYSLAADVCVIERYPKDVSGSGTASKSAPLIAAGYSNGDIQIWNYLTKELKATLRGHKTAVSCITFNIVRETFSQSSLSSDLISDSMNMIASGGKDCDIIVWDLVSLKGVCRLRGHKDEVTGLAFVARRSESHSPQTLLVSASKDTLMMVWDLSTQHCLQTVVGHRCEIWSIVAAEMENHHTLLLTGGSDEFLRGYQVKPLTSSSVLDEQDVLEYCGSVSRAESMRALRHTSTASASGADKCVSLKCSTSTSTSNLIAAQTGGKHIEVYKLRSLSETMKKMKRRLKRIREKAAEGQVVTESLSWQLQDALEAWDNIRCVSKVKGLAFSPVTLPHSSSSTATSTTTATRICRLLVSLANNSLELYDLSVSESGSGSGPTGDVDEEEGGKKRSSQYAVIDSGGHRTDIRSVCISDDSQTLCTCSSESVKIWNMKSKLCIGSCHISAEGNPNPTGGSEGIPYCVSCVFAPGGRFVLVGTKEGQIKIVDCASLHVIGQVDAGGTVWSMATRPDGRGLMAGCGDQSVKFFDFTVSSGSGLHIEATRELRTKVDVLCVRYSRTKSAEKLLFATGLLDNTIQVYFDDSMKFFLSLYGHSLPVLCLDFSSDNSLLVSGSADKTIKIWGLDFGDCHRSMIGHGDSVTCIRFQLNTHYFFSTGKDGLLKFWDADRFEQIQFLPGHRGSVWGLDVCMDGAEIITAGQDRSWRSWQRGEDLVFVEEERERAIEAQVDQDMVAANVSNGTLAGVSNNTDPLLVARGSLESVKGAEQVMSALELVAQELQELQESGEKIKNKLAASTNPLLLGLSPYTYMLRVMRSIKIPDLEQLMGRGCEAELCARVALFLISAHQPQIVARSIQGQGVLQGQVLALRGLLSAAMEDYRSVTGTNCAGLRYILLNQKMEAESGLDSFEGAAAELGLGLGLEPSSNKKKQKNGGKSKSKSKKQKIAIGN